jgi:hypothetical protein
VNCRVLRDAPLAGLWDSNPMFEADADSLAPGGPKT